MARSYTLILLHYIDNCVRQEQFHPADYRQPDRVARHQTKLRGDVSLGRGQSSRPAGEHLACSRDYLLTIFLGRYLGLQGNTGRNQRLRRGKYWMMMT